MKFSDFWKNKEKNNCKQNSNDALNRNLSLKKSNPSEEIIKRDENVKNSGNEKRVLLLFDSLFFMSKLKNILAEMATVTHIFDISQNFHKISSLIEKNQIDLIIIEKNKEYLIEHIVDIARKKRIKIILMTGLKKDKVEFASKFDSILDYCLDDKTIKELKKFLV